MLQCKIPHVLQQTNKSSNLKNNEVFSMMISNLFK